MAQRCGLCGKTEKQHKGRACIDPILLRIAMLQSEAERIEEEPWADDDVPFDDNYDQDFGWNDDHSEDTDGDPTRKSH